MSKQISAAVAAGQEKELAATLEGESVVRLGRTLRVEVCDLAARKVTVVDMQAQRQVMDFPTFFRERIKVISPDVLLQPLRADDIWASLKGRYVYRNGTRRKIVNIDRQPESTLLTLADDAGATEQQTAVQLQRDQWQIRRRVKPNVSQRLAGVFKRAEEHLDAGRPWGQQTVLLTEEEKRLEHAVLIYQLWRARRAKS